MGAAGTDAFVENIELALETAGAHAARQHHYGYLAVKNIFWTCLGKHADDIFKVGRNWKAFGIGTKQVVKFALYKHAGVGGHDAIFEPRRGEPV